MIQASLVEVRLRELPTELWQRARAHQDAIEREFEIMRVSEPAQSVPNRLLDLIDAFDARFGEVGDESEAQILAAIEHGDEMVDVAMRLPIEASGAAREMASMMSEVDRFCREGNLLTLGTPADLVAFREWVLDELIRQIDQGEGPRSWPEFLTQRSAPVLEESSTRSTGDQTETIILEGSLDLANVGDLRDSIQELRNRGMSRLVIDLTNVGFVDSVGIGLLVTTHNRLEVDGMSMRLIVAPRLMKLLELSGLVDLLQPEVSPAP
ncbi:MAG: STAS domain-containing protein [Acidimicrobiia bacterium]